MWMLERAFLEIETSGRLEGGTGNQAWGDLRVSLLINC